jgi:hypothetical protein
MSSHDILAAIERERIAAMGPQPPPLTMEQLQRNKAGAQACRFFQGPLAGGPCKECGGEKDAHPRLEDLSAEEIAAKEREIIEGIHAKVLAEVMALPEPQPAEEVTEDEDRPPPPDELVGALQDRIHKPEAVARPAKTGKRK